MKIMCAVGCDCLSWRSRIRGLIFGGLLWLLFTSGRADAEERFKVAVILPLTGPVAEFGVAAKNGFKLAQKEQESLLKRIDLVIEDSAYDNQRAITAFHKLRSSETPSVVYLWGYGPSQVVSPIAEMYRVPLMVVAGERSISIAKQYTVRFSYHVQMIADVVLDQLRATGVKRLGIVQSEMAYMNGLVDQLQRRAHPDQTIEVVDTFQLSDSSFKSSIAKIRRGHYDGIGVFLATGQISQFYKELKQFSVAIPTFGTDFFDSMKEVRDSDGAMTGAVFGAPYVSRGFVERYVEEFGNDVQVAWAANAYEFAILTGKLFGSEPRTLTAEEILARYRSATDEQGEGARYKYEASPEGSGFDFKVVARRVERDRIIDIFP